MRIFQCPYLPNRWFVTLLYASRARCARSKTIAQQNQSLLRSLFDKEAIYFKFANVSDRLWGWTRFLWASGASVQRLQFPSCTYTLYCHAYVSCYCLIFSAISDHTLHCTMWEYYYLCKTIDKLLTFVSTQFDKYFRLLGLVRVFQCPYVPNRWFVTHLYASRARCARSKTIA